MKPYTFTSLPPEEVIVALYNNAKPAGLGVVVDAVRGHGLTKDEARELIPGMRQGKGAQRLFIDYVKGRRIKVEMHECCGFLYLADFDEIYGAGRGAAVIDFIEDGLFRQESPSISVPALEVH